MIKRGKRPLVIPVRRHDKKRVQDTSQEPEMKELENIFRDMTDEEKTKTEQYLEDQK